MGQVKQTHHLVQQMTEHALSEASGILSAVCQNELHIKLLDIKVLDASCYQSLFEKPDTLVYVVSQLVQTNNVGQFLFVIEDDVCKNFMRQLLHEQARLRELTELEEEAFMEVGNIVINKCINNYAQILNQDLGSHLPSLTSGTISTLMQQVIMEQESSDFLYVKLQMVSAKSQDSAYLLWTKSPWSNLEE